MLELCFPLPIITSTFGWNLKGENSFKLKMTTRPALVHIKIYLLCIYVIAYNVLEQKFDLLNVDCWTGPRTEAGF